MTKPDVIRAVDDLQGIDFLAFDEICIDRPGYAVRIYERPQPIPDQVRGARPTAFDPQRLRIKVSDPSDDSARQSLRAMIEPHVGDQGWLSP